MALSNVDEGLIFEFLSQTQKSMDSLNGKFYKDFENVIPLLKRLSINQQDSATCIKQNQITLRSVAEANIMSNATFYSPSRDLIREFIEWYGDKHNLTVPESKNMVLNMERELDLLRLQLKNRVSIDSQLLDAQLEIEDLEKQLSYIIDENTLLKKKLHSLEKKNKSKKDNDSNLIQFVPPKNT